MTSERVHRLREQLEFLLSEPASHAIERERSTFDNLTGRLQNSFVLFGARKLGRKTLRGLRSLGLEPLAFSDNDPETWGTSIDGLAVHSPPEAAKRFGSHAAFVVTIWGRGSSDTMEQRLRELKDLGCEKVVSFVPLFWKFATTFLPHNALDLPHRVNENAGDVMRCFELLSDEESKSEFLGQVIWRLTGDFDSLPDPVKDEIYFPGCIGCSRDLETFIDCGAYDGDTVLRFLTLTRDEFNRIFAFEPDPQNFRALKKNISRLPQRIRERVELLPFALGDSNSEVSFAATGTVGAFIGEGSYKVRCVRLDDVLKDEPPTYMKMDIEAAEADALRGSRDLIKRDQPVIAACSYHVQRHLWEIPLLLSELNPEYVVVQRQHVQMVEDLVTYAVPRTRFIAEG